MEEGELDVVRARDIAVQVGGRCDLERGGLTINNSSRHRSDIDRGGIRQVIKGHGDRVSIQGSSQKIRILGHCPCEGTVAVGGVEGLWYDCKGACGDREVLRLGTNRIISESEGVAGRQQLLVVDAQHADKRS